GPARGPAGSGGRWIRADLPRARRGPPHDADRPPPRRTDRTTGPAGLAGGDRRTAAPDPALAIRAGRPRTARPRARSGAARRCLATARVLANDTGRGIESPR